MVEVRRSDEAWRRDEHSTRQMWCGSTSRKSYTRLSRGCDRIDSVLAHVMPRSETLPLHPHTHTHTHVAHTLRLNNTNNIYNSNALIARSFEDHRHPSTPIRSGSEVQSPRIRSPDQDDSQNLTRTSLSEVTPVVKCS